MNNKELTKLNSFKKASLPVLECCIITDYQIRAVKNNGSHWIAYYINHDFQVNRPGLVYIEQFVKIAKNYTIDRIEFSENKAEIFTDAGVFAVDDMPAIEDFPTVLGHFGYKDVAQIDMKALQTIASYTSDDVSRPAMMGVYFDKENIAATNGHIMKWIEYQGTEEPFIIPADAIALLSGKEPVIIRYSVEKETVLLSCNGEMVETETIKDPYPDYKSVIPKIEENDPYVVLPVKETVKYLKAAKISASDAARQISLMVNGSVSIQSEDIDLGQSYQSPAIQTDTRGAITIGFNADYLEKVLKDSGKESVRLDMQTPNRASIVDGSGLIMPVMIMAK
ncbi:MAG: hypothetical protein ACOCTU_07275 [Bacteroidota bacterium]